MSSLYFVLGYFGSVGLIIFVVGSLHARKCAFCQEQKAKGWPM